MSDPNFDSIKHLNPYNVEYWQARELQPLLGYQSSWQNFEKVIEKAKVSCEATGNIVADHFNDAIKPITGGKGAVQRVKDYYLSRLACYLIAMNGDPRKIESPRLNNTLQCQPALTRFTSCFKSKRPEYKFAYRWLRAIKICQKPLRSPEFVLSHSVFFIILGYLGLYSMDSEDIRLHKGIPDGGEILDYMGQEELAANLFRITQTDGKLRRERIVSEDRAIETHFGVGRTIRNTLQELNAPLPEDHPSAPSIRKQLEERRRARKKQLRSNGQQKNQDTLL